MFVSLLPYSSIPTHIYLHIIYISLTPRLRVLFEVFRMSNVIAQLVFLLYFYTSLVYFVSFPSGTQLRYFVCSLVHAAITSFPTSWIVRFVHHHSWCMVYSLPPARTNLSPYPIKNPTFKPQFSILFVSTHTNTHIYAYIKNLIVNIHVFCSVPHLTTPLYVGQARAGQLGNGYCKILRYTDYFYSTYYLRIYFVYGGSCL